MVTLLSFIDGLASHALVGHYPPATAIAAIDAFLARLLAGSPHDSG